MAWQSVDGVVTTDTIRPGDLRGSARLYYVRKMLDELLSKVQPTLVVFEDYAMGFRKNTGRLAHLGEVGGVLKLLVWDRGIQSCVVSNATLKKAITGNGHAKKDEVQRHLSRRYGLRVTQNDEADAAALMLVGQALLGYGPLRSSSFVSQGIEIVKGRRQTF